MFEYGAGGSEGHTVRQSIDVPPPGGDHWLALHLSAGKPNVIDVHVDCRHVRELVVNSNVVTSLRSDAMRVGPTCTSLSILVLESELLLL